MQQHRARIPRRHHPAAASRGTAAGPGRSRRARLVRPGLLIPGRPRPGRRPPGRLFFPRGRFPARRRLLIPGSRFSGRQLALHAGRAETAQHRRLVHPQPARDLRIPHPRRPPRPRPLPRRLAGLPRPSRRPDQRGRPLSQRPLVQRGHVARSQPQHPGDVLAANPAGAAPPPPRAASPCRPRRTGTAEPARRRSTSPRLCPSGAGPAGRARHPRCAAAADIPQGYRDLTYYAKNTCSHRRSRIPSEI